MITRWGRAVDPDRPLPEHPRPQLVRDSWLNLNGLWEHAFTATEATPDHWDGEIVVPFSPETELSGVRRQLLPEEWLWYRRTIDIEPVPSGQRLLLHFGAVDQICTVWVNDVAVGSHVGGYLPFTLDITDAVDSGSRVSIVVRVQDFSETHFHARGKQKLDRGRIWYTAQSGIWQTVWLEWVPEQHITDLRCTPLLDQGCVEVTVSATVAGLAIVVIEGVEHRLPTNQPTPIPLAEVRLWAPAHPELYDVQLTLGEDRVTSYFAMREFGIDHTTTPPRFTLNGEPIVHIGLLDQGYWPESLLTPPSDEAMAFDIATAKDLGYTMLRKHVKIEPLRWYHHADRLGMLVWQDLVNGGGRYRALVADLPARLPMRITDRRHGLFHRSDEGGRAEFIDEVCATITLLRNVPSICVWVPFNEAWGQFDANAVAELVTDLDGTRPVNHVSGWIDQGGGQIRSFHRYNKPFRMPRRLDDRVVALSEYGGYSMKVAGHDWGGNEFGYEHFDTSAELTEAFENLHAQLAEQVSQGLGALVYTQLTDVEDELNGLLTWDREVTKIDPDVVRRVLASVDASAGVGRLDGRLGRG